MEQPCSARALAFKLVSSSFFNFYFYFFGRITRLSESQFPQSGIELRPWRKLGVLTTGHWGAPRLVSTVTAMGLFLTLTVDCAPTSIPPRPHFPSSRSASVATNLPPSRPVLLACRVHPPGQPFASACPSCRQAHPVSRLTFLSWPSSRVVSPAPTLEASSSISCQKPTGTGRVSLLDPRVCTRSK